MVMDSDLLTGILQKSSAILQKTSTAIFPALLKKAIINIMRRQGQTFANMANATSFKDLHHKPLDAAGWLDRFDVDDSVVSSSIPNSSFSAGGERKEKKIGSATKDRKTHPADSVDANVLKRLKSCNSSTTKHNVVKSSHDVSKTKELSTKKLVKATHDKPVLSDKRSSASHSSLKSSVSKAKAIQTHSSKPDSNSKAAVELPVGNRLKGSHSSDNRKSSSATKGDRKDKSHTSDNKTKTASTKKGASSSSHRHHRSSRDHHRRSRSRNRSSSRRRRHRSSRHRASPRRKTSVSDAKKGTKSVTASNRHSSAVPEDSQLLTSAILPDIITATCSSSQASADLVNAKDSGNVSSAISTPSLAAGEMAKRATMDIWTVPYCVEHHLKYINAKEFLRQQKINKVELTDEERSVQKQQANLLREVCYHCENCFVQFFFTVCNKYGIRASHTEDRLDRHNYRAALGWIAARLGEQEEIRVAFRHHHNARTQRHNCCLKYRSIETDWYSATACKRTELSGDCRMRSAAEDHCARGWFELAFKKFPAVAILKIG